MGNKDTRSRELQQTKEDVHEDSKHPRMKDPAVLDSHLDWIARKIGIEDHGDRFTLTLKLMGNDTQSREYQQTEVDVHKDSKHPQMKDRAVLDSHMDWIVRRISIEDHSDRFTWTQKLMGNDNAQSRE